jgi:protease PrsW
MTQFSTIELAKQGNSQAIATLLNRAFEPLQVTVRVSLESDRLQVMLDAAQVLEQQRLIPRLQKEITNLGVPAIQTVKVYAWQNNQVAPAWSYEFELSPSYASALALSPRKRSQSPEFWATLRTFRFAAIVPYREVLNLPLYRSPIVRLLLFFGLFPLVVDLLPNRANVQQTAWLLGIYYACIWGVLLFDLIKPTQFSWNDTLKCILFTVVVGVPLLLFLQRVPLFRFLYDATRGGLLPRLVGFVLGVGVLEEFCKALPVYLFLLRSHRLSDPQTSAFYGAMSGLGFAIAEGTAYSLRYALNLTQGDINLGSYVLASTIRFVSLPLFHAILAGISGYFLGLAAINPARQIAIIGIGIAIAATLHGFYNTFAGGVLGLVTIGFSILLFVAYLRRSKQLILEMQQAEIEFRRREGEE